MNKRNFIVFDTETTGLDETSQEIVQIAAVALNGDTFYDHQSGKFQQILKPSSPSTAEPKALSVIGDDLWAKAQASGLDQKTALSAFLQYCDTVNDRKSKYEKPMLVGHNVKFDIKFLVASCKRHGLIKTEDDLPFHYHSVDTMSIGFMFFHADPNVTSYTLDSVAKQFGIARKQDTHDAAEDVDITKQIFVRSMKAFREIRRRLRFNTTND